MQIVIEIDDNLYSQIKYLEPKANTMLDKLLRSIQNSTPLPKGHGRLIDANEVEDAIYKCFDGIQCYDGTGYDIYSDSKESIDKIPTIIEEDKAESEPQESEDNK